MAQVQRIHRSDVVMDDTPTVVYDEGTFRAAQVVDYVLGIVEIVLGLRFVFKLFGANPDAGFASFIYSLTEPLMAPFQAIFNTTTEQGATFEWSVLVAMAVYALLALAIIRLIELVGSRT